MGADIRGKWAVVTGASSGIGRDMAEQLGARGMNVAVVARREDRLNEVASAIANKHGVKTKVIALDLSKPGAAPALKEKLKADGIETEVLVNNAGFGIKGDFAKTPWPKLEEMLNLNLSNLTHLTHAFLEEMIPRRSGRILLVSSIGAYQPTPGYAAYAATKSYVLNFGEALSWELRDTGVTCTVLSPGGTRTEFFEVAGQEENLLVGLVTMSSARVAELGLKGMFRGVPNVLPGWRNWWTAFSTRFVPRRLLTILADLIMR